MPAFSLAQRSPDYQKIIMVPFLQRTVVCQNFFLCPQSNPGLVLMQCADDPIHLLLTRTSCSLPLTVTAPCSRDNLLEKECYRFELVPGVIVVQQPRHCAITGIYRDTNLFTDISDVQNDLLAHPTFDFRKSSLHLPCSHHFMTLREFNLVSGIGL